MGLARTHSEENTPSTGYSPTNRVDLPSIPIRRPVAHSPFISYRRNHHLITKQQNHLQSNTNSLATFFPVPIFLTLSLLSPPPSSLKSHFLLSRYPKNRKWTWTYRQQHKPPRTNPQHTLRNHIHEHTSPSPDIHTRAAEEDARSSSEIALRGRGVPEIEGGEVEGEADLHHQKSSLSTANIYCSASYKRSLNGRNRRIGRHIERGWGRDLRV